MVMSIKGIFSTAKSTAKAPFIGLILAQNIAKDHLQFSITKGNGGVDFLMDQAHIKKLTEISTSECSKTASSMEKERNGSPMETIIRASTSMACLKVSENISGKTVALSEETSNKVFEMAMVSGKPTTTIQKATKAIM